MYTSPDIGALVEEVAALADKCVLMEVPSSALNRLIIILASSTYVIVSFERRTF